jgi:hypothetical protein
VLKVQLHGKSIHDLPEFARDEAIQFFADRGREELSSHSVP